MQIRIEAQGYKPAVSPVLIREDGDQVFNVELSTGSGPTGTVRLPDGTSLAGAEVALCTTGGGTPYIRNGQPSWSYGLVVTTDKNGRFSFPPQVDPYVIAVFDDAGYVEVSQEELASSQEITLNPWGRIEGTYRVAGKPGAHETIEISFDRPWWRRPRVEYFYNSETDVNGHFVFERVPPGIMRVTRQVRLDPRTTTGSHGVPIELRPGQTARVTIGGLGRPVVGQVSLPEGAHLKVDLERSHGFVSIKRDPIPYPPQVRGDRDAMNEWYERWSETPEGKARRLAYRSYVCLFQSDGTFRADDVPAGTYELTLRLFAAGAYGRDGSGVQIGSASTELTLPKIPAGRSDEPFDIGVLKVTMFER